MTTNHDTITSPQAGPEAGISPEFLDTTAQFIGQVTSYLTAPEGTEPAVPRMAITQLEAYSVPEEAERDHLIAALGDSLGINVDDVLTHFEVSRIQEGHATVRLEPWMKAAFGMDDPDTPSEAKGVLRLARLNVDTQPPLTLHEIEVSNRAMTPQGVSRSRMNRIIYALPT